MRIVDATNLHRKPGVRRPKKIAKPTIAFSSVILFSEEYKHSKIPLSAHIRWGERRAPVQLLMRFAWEVQFSRRLFSAC